MFFQLKLIRLILNEEEDPLMALVLSHELCKAQPQPTLAKSPIETEWDEYNPCQDQPKIIIIAAFLILRRTTEMKFSLLADVARRWFSSQHHYLHQSGFFAHVEPLCPAKELNFSQ